MSPLLQWVAFWVVGIFTGWVAHGLVADYRAIRRTLARMRSGSGGT